MNSRNYEAESLLVSYFPDFRSFFRPNSGDCIQTKPNKTFFVLQEVEEKRGRRRRTELRSKSFFQRNTEVIKQQQQQARRQQHGGGQRQQRARLADAGFEAIMMDFRVHGDSDAPHDPACYPKGVLVRDAAALRFTASCLARLDPRVFEPIVASQWLDEYDPPAVLEAIVCPTLLLQADPAAAGMLTDADADDAESRASDLIRSKFAMTGHMMHTEQTSKLVRQVEAFLESIRD